MVSALVYLVVLAETALALALPASPPPPVARDVLNDAINDGKSISDASTDVKNGDYRKGWDKLPRWAQIVIIVVAVVVGLVIIGLISCCFGCLRCATCNCCSCCCSSCGGGGGGGGRTREVHEHHYHPPGPRNTYLPMNDMQPAPHEYAKYEPPYEPPQYTTYTPMRDAR